MPAPHFVLFRITLWIWTIPRWLLYPTVEATCYNSQGFPWTYSSEEPVASWVPCDPGAEVTNCCGPDDYCMSNGLCMDAVIDNMISQQGCTDKNWAGPCQNYCGGTQSDAAGLHFLWRCDGQSHCCGNNRSTTCCEDPGIETFVLEVGTNISHPSATNSNTSNISEPISNSTSGAISSSTNDNRDLAIGLGVGIPLGLALIAALCYLAVQFRKWSKQARAGPEAPAQWYPPGSYKPPEQMGMGSSHGVQEMQAYRPVELESTRSRSEL